LLLYLYDERARVESTRRGKVLHREASAPDLGVPDTRIGATMIGGDTGCPFHPRCPSAIDICRTTAPAIRTLPDGWATCHLVEQQEAVLVP